MSNRNSNLAEVKPCLIAGKKAYTIWKTEFILDSRYQPIKAIGKGAYGIVCSAKDLLTGEKVAIKKIGNAFDNLIDAKRLLREIKLLRALRHENIVGLLDILLPTS